MPKKKVYDSQSLTLLNSGVSKRALATTLPIQGRPDIRKMIEERVFDKKQDDGSVEAATLIFIGGPGKAKLQTELIMSLTMKEMLLSGIKSIAVPLEYILEDDTYVNGMYKTLDFVFLPHFYVTSSSKTWTMFTAREAAKIEGRLKTLYNVHDVRLALYIDGTTQSAKHWWSDRFMEFVARTGITYQEK